MLTNEYERPPGFFKDCTRMQIYRSVEARDKKISAINKELSRAKNAERCYEQLNETKDIEIKNLKKQIISKTNENI